MARKVTPVDLKLVVEKLFRVIDTNQNGTLEKEEVTVFFRQMSQRHKKDFDEDEFEVNWKEMDRNSDEVITEDELYQFMLEKARRDGSINEE